MLKVDDRISSFLETFIYITHNPATYNDSSVIHYVTGNNAAISELPKKLIAPTPAAGGSMKNVQKDAA